MRVEDSTLTGDFPQAALAGDRWSGERVAIGGVTHDGAHLGGQARLRNSDAVDFATAPGARAHGVVLQDADARLEDSLAELGDGPGRESAVLVAPGPAAAPDSATVVRGNVLGGGRYTVHDEDRTDVLITGNRFRRAADRDAEPVRVSRQAVLEDNTHLEGGLLPVR